MGDKLFYLPDGLGFIRQIADAAGAVVREREWSPYGEEMGAAQMGLGYSGEWWDADVGLLYLRARWYHPVGIHREPRQHSTFRDQNARAGGLAGCGNSECGGIEADV